jgi:hypothetical protein
MGTLKSHFISTLNPKTSLSLWRYVVGYIWCWFFLHIF